MCARMHDGLRELWGQGWGRSGGRGAPGSYGVGGAQIGVRIRTKAFFFFLAWTEACDFVEGRGPCVSVARADLRFQRGSAQVLRSC